jgi:hypothetical protein
MRGEINLPKTVIVVNVDWVVLTAAILGLGLAVITTLRPPNNCPISLPVVVE